MDRGERDELNGPSDTVLATSLDTQTFKIEVRWPRRQPASPSAAGGASGKRWLPYEEALGSQCFLWFQSVLQNPPATLTTTCPRIRLSFGSSSLCPPPSDSKVFKAFLLSSGWKVHIPRMMTLQAPQIWFLYTFLHFPPPPPSTKNFQEQVSSWENFFDLARNYEISGKTKAIQFREYTCTHI